MDSDFVKKFRLSSKENGVVAISISLQPLYQFSHVYSAHLPLFCPAFLTPFPFGVSDICQKSAKTTKAGCFAQVRASEKT